MKWHDISTAPRDGTVIRICRMVNGNPTLEVDVAWKFGRWMDPTAVDSDGDYVDRTHWTDAVCDYAGRKMWDGGTDD